MSKNEKPWINHKGEVVPTKYVSGYDKKKEKVLLKLLADAQQAHAKLKAFKDKIFAAADIMDNDMYEAYHMDKPATKGNHTKYSFDKKIRLSMKVNDVIEFDDRIKLAQIKINEFVESKKEGADSDLMILATNAFKTTKGKLDKAKILGLFSYDIKHPTWLEAIDLIKLSITTNHTRSYASIAVRDEQGEYKDINLNISSI